MKVYELDWNNLDKKIPLHYNDWIINRIETATKHIMGDILKNKIYNYIIYYYNKNIMSGYLDTIFIFNKKGNKKIYFDIKNKILRLEKAL